MAEAVNLRTLRVKIVEFCGSFLFWQLCVQTFAIPDSCTDFSSKVPRFTHLIPQKFMDRITKSISTNNKLY